MWSAVLGTPARANHPANISRSLRDHILKQSCFQPVTVPAGIAEKYVNKAVIPEFFYRGYGIGINNGFPIAPSGMITFFGNYRRNKLDGVLL